MPTIVPLLGQFPRVDQVEREREGGRTANPAEVTPDVLVLLVPEVLVLLVLCWCRVAVVLVLVPDELRARSARAEAELKTGEPNLPRPSVELRNVVLNVEVEIDADRFEEVVVDRDEPAFDGHLQILQPPQLLQQIADFVVHLLRLTDDQAQRRCRRS